jgi:hypothetical protein
MKMVATAKTADKRLAIRQQPLTTRMMLSTLRRVLLERLIEAKPGIEILPDPSEFRDWSKSSALKFIEIVIEMIGMLNKGISAMRNSKLYLANHLPVFYIDEDIMGPSLQPIHNPNQR